MPMTDKQLMALSKEELVVLIVEEASEIIQAACKVQRFGFDGHHPKDTKWEESNGLALCVEGEQCSAIVRILGTKLGVRFADLSEQRFRDAIEMWGEK